MSNQIVVLNKGQIAQVGCPEDLYDHPLNHFVARFLGDVNFVHAKVSAVDGDTIEVVAPDLEGSPRLTISRAGRADMRPDQSVDLVVRPARLTVGQPAATAGVNTFAARLVRRDFFGGKSEVIFRSGQVLLKCDVDRDFQARMDGDAALLSITPDHLTWVPPEGVADQ
jgi:ABC-type Fe3+/spermidine/putrescine transport system ATPase subunit